MFKRKKDNQEETILVLENPWEGPPKVGGICLECVHRVIGSEVPEWPLGKMGILPPAGQTTARTVLRCKARPTEIKDYVKGHYTTYARCDRHNQFGECELYEKKEE